MDEHYKMALREYHALMAWLAAYASWLIDTYAVGTDGGAARERACGRKFNKPLPEFGEWVMYPKTLPTNKLV